MFWECRVLCIYRSLRLNLCWYYLPDYLYTHVFIHTYITHTHTHTHTHRKGSREIWNGIFTNTHADTFRNCRNNPRIILISERERMRERETHTRHWYQDFPCTRMLALSFSHYHAHSHTTQTPKENAYVCVCVLFIKQIRYNTQTQVS
jgi:hypothetical protein